MQEQVRQYYFYEQSMTGNQVNKVSKYQILYCSFNSSRNVFIRVQLLRIQYRT